MPSDGKLPLWQLLPRRVAHILIRAYQLSLSAFIGRHCRHEPSCSAYMDEAIQRHGIVLGGWLGTIRLCRCHPWGTSGYDPVPENVLPLHQRFGVFFGRPHKQFVCEAETPKAPKR
jgi:uncharacterized protein